MSLKRISTLAILSFTALSLTQSAFALDDKAVVKGKFKQSKYRNFQIDFSKFPVRMAQRVKLPDAKLPGNWKQLSPEQRADWQKKFAESSAGKALLKRRQDLLAKAPYFDIKIEKNGNYVVYDVPPGVYGLRGRQDKEISGRKFAFEIFGQITVHKDVEELPLDPIEVVVTPLLEMGQKSPKFKVKTHNNAAQLVNGHFKDKHLFINFWGVDSPIQYQQNIQKMYNELKKKHNLEVLSINVDEKRQKAIDFVRQHKLQGRHGFTDGWEHTTLEAYGIRSIPSSWLIAPDGKILMTQFDFRRAFMAGVPSLSKVVEDRIMGKDIPTLAPPEENKKPAQKKASTASAGK